MPTARSLRRRIIQSLHRFLLLHIACRRPPDFVVGADSPGGPYLQRWYVTPWRGWFRHIPEPERRWWQRAILAACRCVPSLYLHKFLRDDDDRALHDHPSWAASLVLADHCIEHTIAAGGVHRRREYHAGSLRFMGTRHAHRIELPKRDGIPQPCWTLFLFGPRVREWGFHCLERGWVHWREFTAAGNRGEVGRGCDA